MSKINFPKKQEQRLIPKYLLEYSEELQKNHPDPSASWGGSGSTYTAGTGIDIDNNVISVDNTVAMKTDIPDVSDFVTSTELSTELADYELKSEAFSGSYNDLSNKPDLSVYELKTDAFTGNYNDLTNKPDLSVYELKTDAFSGSYNDLTDKPTIPDAVSGTNDGTNWTSLTIGSDTYGLASGGTTYTAGTWIGITNDTINVSNPYVSLLDSSNLPRVMISDHTNGTTPTFGNARYCNISPAGFGINDRTETNNNSYTYYKHNEIVYNGNYTLTLPQKTGTIAVTSDIVTSYNDLTDKPTIPTVGNGTITIKKNNTTVDTFTTNQSSNKSINITVPTKTSELTNNSGFITGITSSDITTALGYTPGTSNFSGDYNDLTDKPDLSVYELAADAFSGSYTDLTNKPDLSIYAETSDLATVATTGAYSDLTGTPTIPTATSDLTNDSGFITSSALSGYATETWVGNQGYLTGVSWSDVSNKPTFATVATSGDYDDLLNKPTIPTRADNLISVASGFTNRYTKVMYDQQNGLLTITAQWYNDSGSVIAANTTIATIDSSLSIPFYQFYYPGLNAGTGASIKLELGTSGTIKNAQSWPNGTTLTINCTVNLA